MACAVDSIHGPLLSWPQYRSGRDSYDGLVDGETLGLRLGKELGLEVGSILGKELGLVLGWELGSELGIKLGSPEGVELGIALGAGQNKSNSMCVHHMPETEPSVPSTQAFSPPFPRPSSSETVA